MAPPPFPLPLVHAGCERLVDERDRLARATPPGS